MTALVPRLALVLGSQSPRRQDLLRNLGLRFDVIKPDVDEVPRPGEAPEAYAQRNAREKAAWVTEHTRTAGSHPPGFLVISADTIVVLDEKILEKPRDAADATSMLSQLSGRTHTVISGVTLQSANVTRPQSVVFSVKTQVKIKGLSASEIAAYIRTGEPFDKAGAYAAQGIGSYMVESIIGSYTNVVGLPVAEVVNRLERDFAFTLWES